MASRNLPILTFHSIDDQNAVLSFPTRLFRYGLAQLHQWRYQTLRLIDLTKLLREGAPFPDRTIVITFDDGYTSVYQHAFPVLQQYQMTATIFLTVGKDSASDDSIPTLGARPMLNWSQIREMQSFGLDFGAHTLTHPDLTQLPTDQVRTEMLASKQLIEQSLGIPVNSFAYPGGHHDARVRSVAREYFASACSDALGLIHGASDLFALKRVEMYYLRSERLFNLIANGLLPWYLAARNVPRQIRRVVMESR